MQMSKVKAFFKNAFEDMKESAREQHEVDKAEFAAVKAESRARFEEVRAQSSREKRKIAEIIEREEKIAAATARRDEAEKRIAEFSKTETKL